jgi:uncharacterized protein (TIGR03435 family)
VSVAFAQAGTNPAKVPAASASEAYVPTLTFDVASVRESPIADWYSVAGYFAPQSSSLRVTNFNVMNLLAMAYGVRWDQIVGTADKSTMFNIQAKSDSAADERLAHLSPAQQTIEQRHMLQALLADRFKLKVHWETRQGLAYNLVVAKNGLKMGAAKGEPPTPEERKMWGEHPVPELYQEGDGRAGYDYIAHGCSINDIVAQLAGQFGHPVVDKTGLTGKYDFTLHCHGRGRGFEPRRPRHKT